MLSDYQIGEICGEALLFGAVQAALAALEMGSRFAVVKSCRTQDVIDNGMTCLHNYLFLAFLWTMGTSLILYGNYGIVGFIIGFIANLLYIIWIYYEYSTIFANAAKKYKLNI